MTIMYDEDGDKFIIEDEIQTLVNEFSKNIDSLKKRMDDCKVCGWSSEAILEQVLPAYELSHDVLILLDMCVRKISELDDEVTLLKGIHKEEMKRERLNNIMKGSQ